jgi:hypothetical protein
MVWGITIHPLPIPNLPSFFPSGINDFKQPLKFRLFSTDKLWNQASELKKIIKYFFAFCQDEASFWVCDKFMGNFMHTLDSPKNLPSGYS